MAGKDIYLGKMLESMETKLATIDTMITELQLINIAVSQSVNTLNVKEGNSKSVTLNAADVTATRTSATAADYTAKCFCDGVVTFAGQFKKASGTHTLTVQYRRNGGSWVTIGTASVGQSFVTITGKVLVSKGDTIDFTMFESGAVLMTQKAGSTLSYDIVDIVNGGAFAL